MALGFGRVRVRVVVCDDFGYAQRGRVEGRLRDEAVGEGEAKKTGDAGG